ncbi:DHH family phosphoesterase [Arcobacter sp. FWKO B]|uniref:DHH family phosphoesterase n=1 Tax=Arcobacter sp. FWKO B TaxID=2593672 RepID=UPI001D185D19|nr:bifunctional oligoribonuclease/PAP phosphatase NrnA [Arcobacter sp. FWKO B]
MTQALELIKASKYILIVTHINPDPDTITSALAISNFLADERIKHTVYNRDIKKFQSLKFINRFEKITDIFPKFYDLIISVDCGDMKRFGFVPDSKIPIINIDHHVSNEDFGTLNLIESNRASTAELVYDFFEQNNIKITKNIAQALYVGIYSDTQGFSTSRTNKRTFDIISHLVECGVNAGETADLFLRKDSLAKYRVLPKVLDTLTLHKEGKVATIYVQEDTLARYGATLRECEDALNMVLNIAIVDVAMFFRVIGSKTRVSIRSKNDVDVSIIAHKFGGGGHKLSAGCSINTLDIQEAIQKVLGEINEEKEQYR